MQNVVRIQKKENNRYLPKIAMLFGVAPSAKNSDFTARLRHLPSLFFFFLRHLLSQRCVYIYIYIYVIPYTNTHTLCVCVYIYIYIYIQCVYIYTYTVYMYIYIYAYSIYIYIYIYVYIKDVRIFLLTSPPSVDKISCFLRHTILFIVVTLKKAEH